MKKIYIASLILLTLLCLNGCVRKSISIEDSKQNFKEYTKAIESISEKYGYTFTSKSNLEHGREKYYIEDTTITLNINDLDYIDVSISNEIDSRDKNKCIEYFSIEYCLGYREKLTQFDTALFVELSDIFDKGKLNKKTCDKFLKNLERYQEEVYTFGIKFRAEEEINFFSNNRLRYELYYNSEYFDNIKEKLSFGGYTDKSAPVTYTKQVFTLWILIISILICVGIIVTYRDIRKQKRLKKLYFKTPTI